MTIDDIHYLYKNSIKNNIVLLIDSTRRNKFHYRTPSEFTIEFPEPFRNVIGCEVLNAAIPRTTFTVDKHNGKLRTWMYTYALDDVNTMEIKNQFHDIEIRPTDFTQADSLLSDIVSAFRNIDTTFNVVPDTAAFDSDATIAEAGYLKFESRRSPFIIDSGKLNSPMAPILGFSLHSSDKDEGYVIKQDLFNRDLKIFTMPNAQEIIDSDKCLRDSFTITVDRNEFFKPDPTINKESCFVNFARYKINKKINCGILIQNISINSLNMDPESLIQFSDHLQSQFVRNSMIIENITPLPDDSNVEITCDFVYTMDNSKNLYSIPNHEFFCSRTDETNGDQDDPIRLTEDDDEKSTVRFVNSSSYEAINLHKFRFKISQIPNTDSGVVYVMLESAHSTNDQNLVIECNYEEFQAPPGGDKICYLTYDISWTTTEERLTRSPFNYIRILDADYALYSVKSTRMDDVRNSRIEILEVLQNDYENDIIYNSVMYGTKFDLVPPGIINMVTENYVTLRCPEIENHSRGSYDANDVSPGLALFTIDVRSGYAANKNEFFSVKYKEFHPIGKLSRLHFRFERKSDGQLYDFKGVDLHFILSLKVLSPNKLNFKDAEEMEYPLNPNYNPDYQGFMQNEFDNVESDEEIDSKQIKEASFQEERRLQNMHRRHKARFRPRHEEETDDEYETRQHELDFDEDRSTEFASDGGVDDDDDDSASESDSSSDSDDGSYDDSSDDESSGEESQYSEDGKANTTEEDKMKPGKIFDTVFGPKSLITNTVSNLSNRGNKFARQVQNLPQQIASGRAISSISKSGNELVRQQVPDYVADVGTDAVGRLSSSVKNARDEIADDLAEIADLRLSEVPGYITQQAALSQQASKKKLQKAYQNLPKPQKKKFDDKVAEVAALSSAPWQKEYVQLTYGDEDAGPNEMGMQPSRRRRGEFQG